MVESAKNLANDVGMTFKNMDEETPDFMEPFRKVVHEGEKAGALSTKVKELITVGIAINARCPFCIAVHVRNAVAAGATRAELVEAGNVAVMMGGGPAATYMKYLFDAIEEFGAE